MCLSLCLRDQNISVAKKTYCCRFQKTTQWQCQLFIPTLQCLFSCGLVAMEPRCVVCVCWCFRWSVLVLSALQSHFRQLNESLCVSLQSFLVVRDSVTSQPCLLCVSAGDQNGEVLDYNMNCTGTGMRQDSVWVESGQMMSLEFLLKRLFEPMSKQANDVIC